MRMDYVAPLQGIASRVSPGCTLFDYMRKYRHVYARSRIMISDAEAQVMEVLWAEQPLSAEDVAARLAGKVDWQLPTVKTLLGRLMAKGAVAADKDGRRFLYRPLLAREDWVGEQSRSLLDRLTGLLGGQLAPLVAHFAEQRPLSEADKAALRKLLEEDRHGR
jgi:BlaI family transcriptional regulator, penicillinase repressor